MNDYRQPYRLGVIQMAMSADRNANLAKAVDLTRACARDGGQVLCLPELFRSVYPCQQEDPNIFDWAETIPGPSTDALGAVARETGTWIIAPLFEKRGAGLYHNSIAVLDDRGQVASVYRKMHIPDDPGFYEKFYFTPGDDGFVAAATPYGRVGTLICWDQWFPEAARLTALQGADVLIYPTAIGYLPSEKAGVGAEQLDAWQTVQRGHAVANGLYVAAVNRVGFEKPCAESEGIEFWGHSFVADPFGKVVEQAGDDERTFIVTIDPARIEQVRRTWPFLRDRRIDAYGPICRRWL